MAGPGLLTKPRSRFVYSMNAFEPLIWLVLSWLLVEIASGGAPRLWLPFGLVAGLGAMTKHTIVTFLLAAGVAMVLTPARRQVFSRWLWLGAGIALLIVSPNLIWQATHGWPSIEFYRNAALHKNQPVGPLQALFQQVLTVSPGALPVWVAGVVWLLPNGNTTSSRWSLPEARHQPARAPAGRPPPSCRYLAVSMPGVFNDGSTDPGD